MPTRTEPRKALAWGLVALWACFIWGLGGDVFAAPETSRILGPLLRWLFPNFSPEQHALSLAGLRKLAHVAEYAMFAALAMRALLLSVPWPPPAVVATCLAMAGGLAAADEYRQSLSPARTGAVGDVFLDLAGAAGAVAAFHLLERWLGRPLSGRPARSDSRA